MTPPHAFLYPADKDINMKTQTKKTSEISAKTINGDILKIVVQHEPKSDLETLYFYINGEFKALRLAADLLTDIECGRGMPIKTRIAAEKAVMARYAEAAK
jgi:hypothetical protein